MLNFIKQPGRREGRPGRAGRHRGAGALGPAIRERGRAAHHGAAPRRLGLQVAQARAELRPERSEADAIQALSQQRMAAAEQLERQMARRGRPDAQGRARAEPGTLVACSSRWRRRSNARRRMPWTPRSSSRRSSAPTPKRAEAEARRGPSWSGRSATWAGRRSSASMARAPGRGGAPRGRAGQHDERPDASR